MFDIAFSELIVIAVVALIVIGPERLPKVARTLGLLTGRVQRYVTTVKADIDRELQLEDIKKLRQEMEQKVKQAEAEALRTQADIGHAALDIESSVNAAIESPAEPGVPANPSHDKLQ